MLLGIVPAMASIISSPPVLMVIVPVPSELPTIAAAPLHAGLVAGADADHDVAREIRDRGDLVEPGGIVIRRVDDGERAGAGELGGRKDKSGAREIERAAVGAHGDDRRPVRGYVAARILERAAVDGQPVAEANALSHGCQRGPLPPNSSKRRPN